MYKGYNELDIKGMCTMRLLLLNGPNLNCLGTREPSVYGSVSLADFVSEMTKYCMAKGCLLHHFQSNHEGDLMDRLHRAPGSYEGIIFNAGAFTHYSYALRDAISAISVPVVEVHISNIHKREDFRHTSVLAPVCIGQIAGLGLHSYYLAVEYFIHRKAME